MAKKKIAISQIERVRQQDPLTAEALESLAEAIGNVAQQTTATPQGTTPAPPPPDALQVASAGGIFDVAIPHAAPIMRGANYFLEYSTSSSFAHPYTIDLGASRNFRGFLGNQNLFFRARVQYPTGPPSAPIYFGPQSSPTMVNGGGSTTGPAPLPSQGSGTSQGANGGDGGFGMEISRE